MGGTSPYTKRLYGLARHASAKKLLLVNGFDRSTNSRFDYVRFYGSSILGGGYGFDYALNEDITSGRMSLNDYSTVVWLLGDESTNLESFSSAEQTIVKSFLDGGGHFFVSGSEIAWDLDYKGGSADKDFIHDYLKAAYAADAPGNVSGTYYKASGKAGGIFDGLASLTFDNGQHGTINVSYADALTPQGYAAPVMTYNSVSNYNVAGVIFVGKFPGSTGPVGKLVYLGFPFETLYPATSRDAVMSDVLAFFDEAVSGVADAGVQADHFLLAGAYPNPFNPTTTISWSTSENGPVNLSVYDISGRLTCRIIRNENMTPGSYQTIWNGRTESGMQAASGVYIIRLQQNGKQVTQRCSLQK